MGLDPAIDIFTFNALDLSLEPPALDVLGFDVLVHNVCPLIQLCEYIFIILFLL
jgi:hypothetical protein